MEEFKKPEEKSENNLVKQGEKTESELQNLLNFTPKNSSDKTFENLRRTLDSEGIEKRGESFSDFYYIKYLPIYERDENEEKSKFKPIEGFEKYPFIKEILERYQHTANNRPLEILVCKYSENKFSEFKEKTEKIREQYENMGFKILDPYKYIYIIGYFGGTTGRGNQETIREIKATFPGKIKEIKS